MADDIGAMRSVASKPDIFSSGQRDLLNDNLDPKNVKSRTQPGGPKLSYIEGWHAINEANRIFGFGAWERELVRLERTNCDLVDVTKNGRTEKQWRVGYIATVRVTVHGESGSRHRDGTGFGSGFAKDNALGDAIESAAKEAETDAMKRALSTFGNQFGLALYDKAKANVGPSQLEDDPAPAQTPPARRGTLAAPGDVAGLQENPREPSFHDQPSNVPGGFKSLKTIEVDEEQRTDHTADPEWSVLVTSLRGNCETKQDVHTWWDTKKKDLKQRKPHFAKAFHMNEVIPFAASFEETVWEDAE